MGKFTQICHYHNLDLMYSNNLQVNTLDFFILYTNNMCFNGFTSLFFLYVFYLAKLLQIMKIINVMPIFRRKRLIYSFVLFLSNVRFIFCMFNICLCFIVRYFLEVLLKLCHFIWGFVFSCDVHSKKISIYICQALKLNKKFARTPPNKVWLLNLI